MSNLVEVLKYFAIFMPLNIDGNKRKNIKICFFFKSDIYALLGEMHMREVISRLAGQGRGRGNAAQRQNY